MYHGFFDDDNDSRLRRELFLNMLEAVSGSDVSMSFDANLVVESACFDAVFQIQQLLSDRPMDERHSREIIEEIISILEDKGIRCGTREAPWLDGE